MGLQHVVYACHRPANGTIYIYIFIHIQDRKPLKDEVKIPQSLEEQATAQLKHLVGDGDGEGAMAEHMAELVKARKPVWRGVFPAADFCSNISLGLVIVMSCWVGVAMNGFYLFHQIPSAHPI